MDAEDEALRDACTRHLLWHGPRTAHQQLEDAAQGLADLDMDRYGEGGVVEALESRVAALLCKPAAVYMPSGTMAQQIALRVHADAAGTRVVAFHPTSHLLEHESMAHERLHALATHVIGERHRLLTIEDLQGVAEPLAAVMWELPQREIGGQLPAWDDLVAQVQWARDRGIATHLDGARLWETAPHYDRPLSEIAGLFDSAYVSFYKGLGALAGCCLVGSEELIAEARVWRHRHGGTLHGMWPGAASAMAGMDLRLPRMAAYRDHAIAVAAALKGVDGVEIVPGTPQVNMMHLHLHTTEAAFLDARRELAMSQGVWTWNASYGTVRPEWRVVELTVGDATLDFTPAEVADLVGALASN